MKGLYLVGLLVLASFGSVHAITLSDFLTGVNPDSPVYKIKIIVEEIDLKLPGDEIAKREVFAQRRLFEAQYIAERGNFERAKILIKESDDHIIKIMAKLDVNHSRNEIEKFEKLKKASAVDEKYKNSILVIENLLQNSRMPNASRQGLQTALEAVRKYTEDRIEETELETEKIKVKVDEKTKVRLKDIEVEVRRKSKVSLDNVDITDCISDGSSFSAQIVTRWENPNNKMMRNAYDSCQAKKFSDAGWKLIIPLP